MKRDIRDLFKEEEVLQELPSNHREEFLNKLPKEEERRPKLVWWLSAAAVVVIAITLGYNILNSGSQEETSPMLAQIEAVETEYLQDIEEEWQNFVAIADDEVLIARFKKLLEELDKDYQDISIQFRKDSNNIVVVEALVENLKTRLQILKDIQEHIKILNQNNEQYEKSI